MKPTFVIGDAHGQLEKVVALLREAGLIDASGSWSGAESTLWFMGDLVDRGPDAAGVLRRVHGLCTTGRAQCLMGNHEYALLRSIGAEAIGLAPDADFFEAWRDGFGGDAVLKAYGVEEASDLRAALGPLVDWLALLPWVLQGTESGRQWLAVHAGLDEDKPFAAQIAHLQAGWRAGDYPPEALFSKSRRYTLPRDLPSGCCVVSGHTPIAACFVTESRILCDTSGGLRDRALSAVIWPEGRVISG